MNASVPGDGAAAESGDGAPEISVVIASVNGLPYPLACLEALSNQDGGVSCEVILADCTGPGTVEVVRERFPDVKVLAFDEQKSVPWLRSAGIQAARASLVAVTEDHCVPRPDWLVRLVDAVERTGWAAVGGGVENESTERLVDWAVYFCEYSGLMSPVPEGPTASIPGMNVVYDMDRLAPVREVFGEGLWENFLHDRLLAAGYVIGLDPSIVVGHKKHFTVRMFLAERFHYSRAFGGWRVKGAGILRRLGWAALTPLLPALIVYRVTRNVVIRRRHVGWFLKGLPLVLLFSATWTIGEFLGYLTGPGDSLVKIR
jgi:glycosyltransferase involved in cell wall biosynthesis